MVNIIHATFARSEDGIRAVESLLYRNVRAEDISLILPETQSAGGARLDAPSIGTGVTEKLHSPDPTPAPDEQAAARAVGDLPYPPPLPALPPRNVPEYYGREDVMSPQGRGYRYDALGAVMPDPLPKRKSAVRNKGNHEARTDAEEGAGLGLGLGLLTALCIPGLGMIVGSGTIVAGLAAAVGIAGGIAGGVYGTLIDRGVAQGIARIMSDHLEGGGTTLSVSVYDARKEGKVVRIMAAFGGHLIKQPRIL